VNTEKRPLTIDDLARIRTLSDPQLSPDGSRIAVVLRTMDVEKNRNETHLHLVDAVSGEMRQVTRSSGPGGSESSPRWSPDGKSLAFVSGREGKKPQLFLLPLDGGGEAERLTDLPQGAIADFHWSPDGSRIAFRYRPVDEEWREEAAEERKKKERSTPPREITRLHFREEGTGFLPRERWHLHTLDLATREVKPLTTGDRDDGAFCWSPDGTRIAVVRSDAPDPDRAPNTHSLYVLPADGGGSDAAEPLRLNAPLGPKDSPAWSPDGSLVAFFGHDAPGETWGVRNYHVWVVPADGTGEARDLSPGWDVTFGSVAIGDVAGGGPAGPVWRARDNAVLALASDRGAVDVYRLATSGGEGSADATAAAPPARLTEGVHAVLAFSADAKAENCALLLSTPADAGDLYLLPRGSSFFRRLTRVNDDVLAAADFNAAQSFETVAADGRKVPCFSVLPPDFAENPAPRPTVLYIHGGPHAMYAHSLFHEYQALAAAGYVVVYPNPRGSKGYGEEWTGAIRGDWGTPAQADCEACLDYAIEKGWADPSRLGVAGGSYGGYLTGWIVGHSHRFKAAVAERGVYNLVSMAGTCDFTMLDDRAYFDATATDDPAEYLRNSPLTYAGNVTTPLLLIHSEGDLRCPIEQADQFYSALKRIGKYDVTYLRYGPEANHNLSRTGPPDIRLDRQRRIHAFFDKYLKGNTTEQ